MNGVKYVRPGGGFVPNFQMFEKVDVNGQNEHPLYAYLKYFCPPTSEYFRSGIHYSPVMVNDVRWNWEKFLVNRRGHVAHRYHHPMEPVRYIRDDIITLLADKLPVTKAVPKAPGGDLIIG